MDQHPFEPCSWFARKLQMQFDLPHLPHLSQRFDAAQAHHSERVHKRHPQQCRIRAQLLRGRPHMGNDALRIKHQMHRTEHIEDIRCQSNIHDARAPNSKLRPWL